MEYSPFCANFVSKIMRRLKKNYFITLFCATVGVLGLVRLCSSRPAPEQISTQPFRGGGECCVEAGHDVSDCVSDTTRGNLSQDVSSASLREGEGSGRRIRGSYHPIYSVPSFSGTFCDLQETQIVSARKWGVKPVRNRQEAECRKDELVYIGSNPYYKIDPGMSSSIPYLVPHAARVLETIARNYLDSLHIKGIPMHKVLVSSVLRTEEDVERLRRTNVNASPESCHRFGTTFDIPYNRYSTVTPPDEQRRAVQNDTLKWVLAEVLRDAREDGLCYVKYEVKQGCFHITAR